MIIDVGTYSFLPWLRQGIAINIKNEDHANVMLRASVTIKVLLDSEEIPQKVALYGPGDIIGIQSKAIVRTEPRDWITNFEANYLPYIEFYDEDFPWRYTPAAPDIVTEPELAKPYGRLCPWIMLVVLKEDEFNDGRNIASSPLPYIEVKDAGTVFPPHDQLWAWVHVHINEDIVNPEENEDNTSVALYEEKTASDNFSAVVARNPDLAYSRIICPRRLSANTAYHAFLIPVFESGRVAGLGQDVKSDIIATASSWDNNQTAFPYYHRWYFRTGTVGDFEYLVRLLEAKPVDNRVGRRDFDAQNPGSNIEGIAEDRLDKVLRLGGALQVPFAPMLREDKKKVLEYEHWDRLDDLTDTRMQELLEKERIEKIKQSKPHKFQTELAAFVNLADNYTSDGAAVANKNEDLSLAMRKSIEEEEPDDPLITPPLYGRWHARVRQLLKDQKDKTISPDANWINELNLDPRWRATAGFGTKVIQDNQEEYMDAAWGQVGEVLEANARIRRGQLAKEASWAFYTKHIMPMKQKCVEKALMFTASVQKRIRVQNMTVFHHVKMSRIPRAVFSAPMRRIIRPRGRVMRWLPFTKTIQPVNLIDRINKAQVFPAPPKKVPDAVPTLHDLLDILKPRHVPGVLLDVLSKLPWLHYLPLFLAAVMLILLIFMNLTGKSLALASAVCALSLVVFALLRRWTKQVKKAEMVLEDNQKPEVVDTLPKYPHFKITAIGEDFTPSRGNADSQEAVRLKAALRTSYEFVQRSGEAGAVPELLKLNVNLVADEIVRGINPEKTIPRLILNSIRIPAFIFDRLEEGLKEVMAYPEFDIPMYDPLAKISSELFLPNINYIEQNTISLLETNQKFIESYMVGLNHEFARELLWREYPTDQRGSYFRQFWDVSDCLDPEESDLETLREKLRDIPPLHHWGPPRKPYTMLGDHDHREEGGKKEEETVLVIRGELLKKYPNAVIYAHKAAWQTKDGEIDTSLPRLLVTLDGDELENPPRDKIKTPLYEAKVEPDIFFFGFDLTIDVAKGGTGENSSDDAGWFFVIKERPGEPRFGLDINDGNDIYTWNDLSWGKIGVTEGNFIDMSNIPDLELISPVDDPEHPDHYSDPNYECTQCEQYEEDSQIEWNDRMDAAEVAYILYQVPVLIAVHAQEMLPKDEKEE